MHAERPTSPETYARANPSSPGAVARYVVPRGVSRSNPTVASSGPAVLPSYAVNFRGS